MLIYSGRVLMVLVWGGLLLNIPVPFPHPLNIFINAALVFTLMMHGLQLLLLKAGMAKTEQPLTRGQQWRIFIFGVFELLAMQKVQNQQYRQNQKKQHPE